MKRILSMVIVLVMLLSVISVSASGSNKKVPSMYEENFINEYGMYSFYYEIYHHYTEDNNIDWALVSCASSVAENPSEWERYSNRAIVGDILVYISYFLFPFETGYAIYDVEKDEFTDLFKVDLESYEGLKECLDEYHAGIGSPIGDADGDVKLTILDATEIQRALAGIVEFRKEDYVRYKWSWIGGKYISYISDMNRDGVRDILDATCIQRKLAHFENYLAVAHCIK